MGKLTDTLKAMGYELLEEPSTASADRLSQVHNLRARSIHGQSILLSRDETPILFPGDTDGIPNNDWTGEDGVRTTHAEVYRDYYGMDDESYCMLVHGMSRRSWDYLEGEKQRIGLTGMKEAPPESFFVLDEFDVGRGVGTMEAGRYADGRFVAQSLPDPLNDEENVLRMHFTRLPEKTDAEDGLIIRQVESDLMHSRRGERFTCADCGVQKHWLDIPGTLREKHAQWSKRKCGCAAQQK